MLIAQTTFEGAMQNITGSSSQSERTDERLLRDYVASKDAGAFAALVRRHGGMVFGVCRRVLWREQDVEDAFQATFIVLMRKASSLGRPNLLGNWLYGVAYRIASKIRAANIRQRTREVPMVDLPAPEADHDVSWSDLRPLLDDELQRLPQRYRMPMVMFYLEGKSAEEVASTLGRPKGTVLSQLARARERLRVRLARRKLALSAGVLSSLLARTASSEGAAPERLIDWGAQVHILSANGATTGVSAQANLLAQQALKDMLRRRLLTIGALLLAVLLALLVGLITFRTSFSTPPAVEQPNPALDLERLQGIWQVVAIESNGRTLLKEEFPITKLKIQGDTILHESPVHHQEVTFQIQPEQNPKTIDMQGTGYHTETYKAIYSLEGDTLRICRPDDDERPTEFTSRPGSKILLYTAKRIPPGP